MGFNKNTSYIARLRRRNLADEATVREIVQLVLNDMGVIKDDYQSQIDGLVSGSALKKKSYTIGAPGVAGCDYNFTSAANMTEQSIQLGATTIIPATSPVASIVARCIAGMNGAITGTVDVGLDAGTDEYMSAVNIDDTDEITSVSQVLTPSVSATSVYFSATPDANWSTLTTWKVKVDIYYFDGSI